MSDIKLQAIIQCAACDRAAETQYHRRWLLVDQEGYALSEDKAALAQLTTEVDDRWLRRIVDFQTPGEIG